MKVNYYPSEHTIPVNNHYRWDEDHRKVCEDCYADYIDQLLSMAEDARLDALMEQECAE